MLQKFEAVPHGRNRSERDRDIISLVRTVVTDPRFLSYDLWLARFAGVWAILSKGKNLFRYLRHGPQTPLVRGIHSLSVLLTSNPSDISIQQH